MDTDRKKEILELAKTCIDAAIEAVEYVCLKDEKRGEFFSRIHEYLKDTLKEPNGLDGYLAEVEKDIEKEDAFVNDWDKVVILTGYIQVKKGEAMWANDLVYYKEKWQSLKDVFKKKHRDMLGLPYDPALFLLIRRGVNSGTVAKATTTVPAGYIRLAPEDTIRWTDLCLDTSGQFTAFSYLNDESKAKVGMKYKNANLKLIIRREPLRNLPTKVEKQTPLPGFRHLVATDFIQTNDMMYIQDRGTWMSVGTDYVVGVHGLMVGLQYLEKYGCITRMREQVIEATQPPLLPAPTTDVVSAD